MRPIVAFAAALFVTAMLFLLMQALIRDRVLLVDETPAPPKVGLVDVPPEEPPPPDEPVDPPVPKPTPLRVTTELVVVVPPELVEPSTTLRPTDRIPTPVKATYSNTGGGDPMPIAAIPPQYPRQQLIEGVEGWVRVGFTIDVDGAVRDAAVIDAKPRRGVFDQAALTAITRWRFAPRRDETGAPVASRAEYTIEFKIDDGV